MHGGVNTILGAWVDMGNLSSKIADRAYSKYFENTDRLVAEFGHRDAAVLHRYRVSNFIRLYEESHQTAGTDNLEFLPPVLAPGLPQAWGVNGFAATVKKLVLVTHGWNASAMGWPNEYLTLACNRQGATIQTEIPDDTPHVTGVAKWCRKGDALLMSYNWSDGAELVNYRESTNVNLWAVRPPSFALSNAQVLGKSLGDGLKKSGVRPEFAHVIAHSAGSGLIEELSAKLKADNPAGVRQQTFSGCLLPESRQLQLWC
jgi:hypothetical protein